MKAKDFHRPVSKMHATSSSVSRLFLNHIFISPASLNMFTEIQLSVPFIWFSLRKCGGSQPKFGNPEGWIGIKLSYLHFNRFVE